jgi:hypothetical protein
MHDASMRHKKGFGSRDGPGAKPPIDSISLVAGGRPHQSSLRRYCSLCCSPVMFRRWPRPRPFIRSSKAVWSVSHAWRTHAWHTRAEHTTDRGVRAGTCPHGDRRERRCYMMPGRRWRCAAATRAAARARCSSCAERVHPCSGRAGGCSSLQAEQSTDERCMPRHAFLLLRSMC